MNSLPYLPKITPARMATGCALVVAMIGLTGMARRAIGADALMLMRLQMTSVDFNTAFCLFLLGAGLWGRAWPAWRLGCGLLTTFVAVLTLGEYVMGYDFGIDQFFVRDMVLNKTNAGAPGRIPLIAALCFVCCGMGLALLQLKNRRWRWAVEISALAAGGTATIVMLGYGLEVGTLYSLTGLGTIALEAAVAIILLSWGLHCADHEGMSVVYNRMAPTRWYLWIGFGVFTALLFATCLYFTANITSIGKGIDNLTRIDRERSVAAREMQIHVLNYTLAIGDVINGSARGRVSAANDAGKVAAHLETYKRLVRNSRQSVLATRFAAQWQELYAHGQALLAAGRATPDEHARLASMRLALKQFLDAELQSDAVAAFDTQSTTLVADTDATERLTLFFLIAGVVIALTSSFYVSRGMLRMEQGLRNSEERLKLATESANIGIWDHNLVTNELTWDDAMYALYDARREDFPRPYDAWSSRLHPEDKTAAEAAVQDAIAGSSKYSTAFRILLPDGKVRHIKSEGHIFRDRTGRPLQMIGTNLDITDVTNTAQALAARDAALEASKCKSTFLSTMSHEIRTTTNDLFGATQLLLYTDLNEQQRSFAKIASDSGNALLTLLNDIPDFSKLEAGNLEIQNIAFEPESVIEEAVGTLSFDAQAKQLGLNSSVDSTIPARLLGDPRRLRQILLNLIGNAIKSSPAGEVSVRVLHKAATGIWHRVRIEVQDTGIALTKETADKLFSPFTQADESNLPQSGGTGLGLAICKQLVTRMGGQIGFDLTVTQGALIWMELTLEQAPTARGVTPGRAQDNAIGPITDQMALVVDDNQINQKIAEALLTNLGYTCHSVENGQLALEAVQANRYNLIMMDCQMPVMDGYEATARIRLLEKTTGRHVLIIAMTAHAMTGARERFLESGMDDYLTKPFSILSLRNMLLRWFPEGVAKAAVNQ